MMHLGDTWGSEEDETKVPAATLNYYMQYLSRWLGAPSNLLQSIAQKESSYNPYTGFFFNGCNEVNACGLMQLRDVALWDIANNFGFSPNPLDPIQAIVGATLLFYLNKRYLRYYLQRSPTLAELIVAYNGGVKSGVQYAQTGYAPTSEGQNYLAFVGRKVGIA